MFIQESRLTFGGKGGGVGGGGSEIRPWNTNRDSLYILIFLTMIGNVLIYPGYQPIYVEYTLTGALWIGIAVLYKTSPHINSIIVLTTTTETVILFNGLPEIFHPSQYPYNWRVDRVQVYGMFMVMQNVTFDLRIRWAVLSRRVLYISVTCLI